MTDTTRDLLISLSSHMAYMQGQLEARHELDDPEDFYWYRESVLLRQKVTDALAHEPAVPAPPADGEVADDALALFVESQRPMDPEVAAILTPDVLWDLYEGTPLPADGSRRTQEIRADILTIAPELENNG